MAGGQVLTTNTSEQTFMNLSNQPDRNRQRLQSVQSVIHRSDVIEDFVDVVGAISRKHLSLGRENVL